MLISHDPAPEQWPSTSRMRIDLEAGDVMVTLICRFLHRNLAHFGKHLDFDHPMPPFTRVYLFKRGGARVEAAGREFELVPGRIYFLPCHLSFVAHYAPRSELIGFRIHVRDRTGESVFQGVREVLPVEERPLYRALVQNYERHDLFREYSLLMLAVREAIRPVWVDLVERARKATRFERIFQHLGSHPIAATRIEELAALYGVTANALSKRFHRVMGIPLKEFLIREQIRRAQELLLRTDRSIEEIAYDLGHESPNYFHRLFRNRCGVSPGRYRSEGQGSAASG